MQDPEYLHWQAHGQFPASSIVACNFVRKHELAGGAAHLPAACSLQMRLPALHQVMELPTLVSGGMSKSDLKGYLIAINKASFDAGGPTGAPFTTAVWAKVTKVSCDLYSAGLG